MKINPERFAHLYKTQKSFETDYFLIEGLKNIDFAQKAGLKMFLFSSYEIEGFDLTNEIVMKKITNNHFIKEIGICRKFKGEIKDDSPVIICDNLQDFGNIGTIIRNNFAFGFENLVFIRNQDDLWNHKVFEASRGLFFQLKPCVMTTEEALNYFKDYNFIKADLDGKNIKEYKIKNNKTCIVFGNESFGISEEIKEKCRESITININFESLNVAVAHGVILYNL